MRYYHSPSFLRDCSHCRQGQFLPLFTTTITVLDIHQMSDSTHICIRHQITAIVLNLAFINNRIFNWLKPCTTQRNISSAASVSAPMIFKMYKTRLFCVTSSESCKVKQMKLLRTFGNYVDKVFLDNILPIQVVTHKR